MYQAFHSPCFVFCKQSKIGYWEFEMKAYADAKVRAKTSSNIGDTVLARQRKHNKLSTRFDPVGQYNGDRFFTHCLQIGINANHCTRMDTTTGGCCRQDIASLKNNVNIHLTHCFQIENGKTISQTQLLK